VLSLVPGRLRLRPQPRVRAAGLTVASSNILLTGTQVGVHNALVAALLDLSTLIVLTGETGFGKTTVLAAALSCISDPALQIIRLDDPECGVEDAFQTLFATVRFGSCQRQPPERRVVLITDQAETMLPGTLACLELLTRMPGKEALVQLVVVGRPEFLGRLGDSEAKQLRELIPAHFALSPLSEQDAWELFYHRVSSAHALRSARRLVATLLERSGGLPGRFDEALRMAVATGLLKGVPSQPA